jgi:hypothetical protein
MIRIFSPTFASLAKIRRFNFILPVFFAILVSTICAQFVLLAEPLRDSKGLIGELGDFLIVLNLIAVTLMSIMSLLIFFRIFKKRPELALKILVAVFIMGGVLSTLLFGKLVFNLLGIDSPLFLVVTAITAYAGAYFAYLVLVDALSERMKNSLFVICSGLLGSFLGILLPVIPVLLISSFLSILDLFLIKRKTLEDMVGEEAYEKLIINVTFSNKGWGIGIGDLTCYAMIASNTLITFGFLAGVISLFLILLGSFLSMALTVRMFRVPGLPIPVVLGLLPSILLLFF